MEDVSKKKDHNISKNNCETAADASADGNVSSDGMNRDELKVAHRSKLYSFLKFLTGTVIVGLVPPILNYQIQKGETERQQISENQKLEIERIEKQSQFIAKFVDHALDEDHQRRLDFAQYFATLSPDIKSKQDWEAYVAVAKEKLRKQMLEQLNISRFEKDVFTQRKKNYKTRGELEKLYAEKKILERILKEKNDALSTDTQQLRERENQESPAARTVQQRMNKKKEEIENIEDAIKILSASISDMEKELDVIYKDLKEAKSARTNAMIQLEKNRAETTEQRIDRARKRIVNIEHQKKVFFQPLAQKLTEADKLFNAHRAEWTTNKGKFIQKNRIARVHNEALNIITENRAIAQVDIHLNSLLDSYVRHASIFIASRKRDRFDSTSKMGYPYPVGLLPSLKTIISQMDNECDILESDIIAENEAQASHDADMASERTTPAAIPNADLIKHQGAAAPAQ